MKNTLKMIGLGIVGLILLFALVFGTGLFGLEYSKFFGPKKAEVRRQVFEESSLHGIIRELDKMRTEWAGNKDPEFRTMIEARALRNASPYDRSKLPSDIAQWLNKIDKR